MNKDVICFMKFLYNDKQLSMDSLEKAFNSLVNEKGLTKYELICDFEEDLQNNIIDFKTEILDCLLILLAQLKDIEEVRTVYRRLNTIQAILAKFKEQIAEAEFESREAKDIEEEAKQLNEIYGYKAQPDELPYFTC